MTQVQMGEEVIETNLPAEAVADLQQPAEPAEPNVEEAQTNAEDAPVLEPQEPAKPEAVAEPITERPKKATPIATLLDKKHELEVQLETERDARKKLEDKLAQAAQQPTTTQTDDDIKALAEEYGLDESLLARIVNTARKGVNPELPKEVQDLLSERQAEKQQQAELQAFNKRVDSLAKTLPAEQFSDPKVREKLLELAYSTEKAPDGEPYFQKELSELYFAYIKPEIEPGKTSAEPSQGGSQASAGVVDFEEILNDDTKMEDFAKNSTREEWQAFTKWRDAKQGDTPIIRRTL
jgi:hypothetical protein